MHPVAALFCAVIGVSVINPRVILLVRHHVVDILCIRQLLEAIAQVLQDLLFLCSRQIVALVDMILGSH